MRIGPGVAMTLVLGTLVAGSMLISPTVAAAQDPNAARRQYELQRYQMDLERWKLQQEEQRANRQQQMEQLQRDREYQLQQQKRADWQNEQQQQRAVESYKINEERRRYQQERSDALEREEDARHEGDPNYQLGKDIGNVIKTFRRK